jgi:hypothetical protein
VSGVTKGLGLNALWATSDNNKSSTIIESTTTVVRLCRDALPESFAPLFCFESFDNKSLVKAEADYVQPALMRILTEDMTSINPAFI